MLYHLFQYVKKAILTVQTVRNIVHNDTAIHRLQPVMFRQEVVVLLVVKLAGRDTIVQKVYMLIKRVIYKCIDIRFVATL